jgi:hypothetical protein
VITKNTHQLEVGDIVCEHGARFELIERRVSQVHYPIGETLSFTTKLLSAAPNCQIPLQWRDSWTVQGNRRAHWRVEA